MFGARGACRVTESSATSSTETPIALERGMWSLKYCASSAASTGSPCQWVSRGEVTCASRPAGCAGHPSSKEAGIPVLPDQSDELLDRGNVRSRPVTVPFHVLTQPEDPPAAHRTYVGRLGDRNLDSLSGSTAESLPHLENLHALTGETKCEIDLLTKVEWRAASFDEGSYRLAYACRLEFGEG